MVTVYRHVHELGEHGVDVHEAAAREICVLGAVYSSDAHVRGSRDPGVYPNGVCVRDVQSQNYHT